MGAETMAAWKYEHSAGFQLDLHYHWETDANMDDYGKVLVYQSNL